jgi:superfamily II DNA or RNA helicase
MSSVDPITTMILRDHQTDATNKMTVYHKGIICAVTGAGKTLIGVYDTIREFKKEESQTVVVVAPRLMLANQLSNEYLEFITNASVFHCHSGETKHKSSTNPKVIKNWFDKTEGHKLIFTTYHSLHRIIESGIKVDTAHIDEAHNSIQKNFFPAVEQLSKSCDRFYSYTATPKYSLKANKPGMNRSDVYGQIIVNVSAPEMVSKGHIVSPKIKTHTINSVRDKEFGAERDCMTLLDTIVNEDNMDKVLVAAPNTKVLIRMLAETDFMKEIQSFGYDLFWITAKYGAFINGNKVDRDVFFDTLKSYGKENGRKFVVLHYSILSEGIDCPGLTSCILMRNLDYIAMAQTIGRVIRLHPDDSRRLSEGSLTPDKSEEFVKPYGFVHVPVYNNTGIGTARRVQAVSDTIFVHGEPIISTINK